MRSPPKTFLNDRCGRLSLYFCSEVAKHNKVTLTGECADEIFGGYPWFYRPELMNRDDFPWSADPAARTSILSDDVLRTLDLAEYSHARYEETLSHVPHLDGESLRKPAVVTLAI